MKFEVILADPPWKNKKAHSKVMEAYSDDQYSGLKLDELCALPVADVAADNAYLFLWSDSQHMHLAPQVAKAWGFKDYATTFTWLKTEPSTGSNCAGIGFYSLIWSETLWLFKRGKPAMVESAMQNPFQAPRQRHSRKPDEIYEFIETKHFKKSSYWQYPESRLELFARTHTEGRKLWEPRPGWVQVGDEFDGPVGLGEDITASLLRLAGE